MKQLANYLEISVSDLKGLLKIVLLGVLAFSVKPIASVIGFGFTFLLCVIIGGAVIFLGKKD